MVPWPHEYRIVASPTQEGRDRTARIVDFEPGEAYGLQILQAANVNGDLVSDCALYFLLNRLEKAERSLLIGSFRTAMESMQHYELTPESRSLATNMRTLWLCFRTNVTTLVEGNNA